MLFIGFPDGAEIINLTAAVLMAGAMVPYGIQLLSRRDGTRAGTRRGLVATG